MKTIHDLKMMIAEPASKEWFRKHGLPKGKKGEMAKKMSGKSPASLSVESKGMKDSVRSSINRNDKDMNK